MSELEDQRDRVVLTSEAEAEAEAKITKTESFERVTGSARQSEWISQTP